MNVVEILVTGKNLATPALESAAASAKGLNSTVSKISGIAVTAFAGVMAESVKMASKFDSEMALLQTQAGVSEGKIAGLKKGVLDLAGQVGFSPTSLAESLFHVESNFESMGISSAKALNLVKVAAEGAATGHADLVDVTNALTAAVASGIPGVQDFSQAMGVLNGIVGVGDMNMQQLAQAFGSGMVATVKGFGLSITDVGAALAVFGDNNIRGSLAGNQLRMSVMALAHPIATAGATLKTLGLQSDTLAKDMQQGGLLKALDDLQGRMQKAGIGAKEQGDIITQAFGRKAGAGLNVLLDQMDRLRGKYPALQHASTTFNQSFADTQKTFAQQMKELQGHVDALMISLGEKLIPVIQKIVAWMARHQKVVLDVGIAMGALVALMVAYTTAMKVAAIAQAAWTVATWAFRDSEIAAAAGLEISRIGALGLVIQMVAVKAAQLGAAAATRVAAAAQWLWNAAMDANPIGLVVAAIALLVGGFIVLYKHSELVRIGVATFFDFMKAGAGSMAAVFLTIIKGLVDVWLFQMGLIVKGAAMAFSWVPGMGGKLKAAARSFDDFSNSVNGKLQSMINKANSFAQASMNAAREKELKIRIDGWNNNLNAALAKLKTIPASKKAQLIADITNLQVKIANAQREIDNLHGKTVTINTTIAGPGKSVLSTNAHGGVVSTAATGGARGALTWVGEQGPELVRLPFGSMVYPSGQSKMMAGQGGGGGPVVIELRSSGSAMDEFLLQILRRAIRVQGGNVQTVLGRG